MKIACCRTLRGFEPLEPGALRHIKLGDIVEVDITRPRSHRRNAWFWAYITTVHENLSDDLAEKYPSTESLVAALKVLTGHAEWFWLPGDPPKQVVRPKSFHSAPWTRISSRPSASSAYGWRTSTSSPVSTPTIYAARSARGHRKGKRRD